jgi:hypothetical protein
VDSLRELTGIGFARAENLVDATQNADVFVEVSGILKAHAVSLLKICGDLRLLASGPEAGFGEIRLPARQAGSSIMPGKVNPVIPEAVSQAAMLVMGHDATIALACAAGSLELNPFLPLIADIACWKAWICWRAPMTSCAAIASTASKPTSALPRNWWKIRPPPPPRCCPCSATNAPPKRSNLAQAGGRSLRETVIAKAG